MQLLQVWMSLPQCSCSVALPILSYKDILFIPLFLKIIFSMQTASRAGRVDSSDRWRVILVVSSSFLIANSILTVRLFSTGSGNVALWRCQLNSASFLHAVLFSQKGFCRVKTFEVGWKLWLLLVTRVILF